jgi:hypothetical protein
MPRQTSLVTAIRDFVRREVGDVLASLFGRAPKKRRRGGKWRPGGPGRPPKKVATRRRRKKK